MLTTNYTSRSHIKMLAIPTQQVRLTETEDSSFMQRVDIQ
jgi:hypothetical protein